jgi:NADH-quinone oxidoreductase subunit J
MSDSDVGDRGRMWPGVAALALFAVLAWVFVGAEFGQSAGFPDGAEITASIGYAMFNIGAQNAVPSEGMLIPFEIIDLVLVAALVGAVMLARREESGEITTALRSAAVERESSPQEVVADGGERTDGSRTSKDESFGSEEVDD